MFWQHAKATAHRAAYREGSPPCHATCTLAHMRDALRCHDLEACCADASLGPQSHPWVAHGVGRLVLLGRFPRDEMAVPLVQQPDVEDGAKDECHDDKQGEDGGDDARWATAGRCRGEQAYTAAGQALQTGDTSFTRYSRGR